MPVVMRFAGQKPRRESRSESPLGRRSRPDDAPHKPGPVTLNNCRRAPQVVPAAERAREDNVQALTLLQDVCVRLEAVADRDSVQLRSTDSVVVNGQEALLQAVQRLEALADARERAVA